MRAAPSPGRQRACARYRSILTAMARRSSVTTSSKLARCRSRSSALEQEWSLKERDDEVPPARQLHSCGIKWRAASLYAHGRNGGPSTRSAGSRKRGTDNASRTAVRVTPAAAGTSTGMRSWWALHAMPCSSKNWTMTCIFALQSMLRCVKKLSTKIRDTSSR